MNYLRDGLKSLAQLSVLALVLSLVSMPLSTAEVVVDEVAVTIVAEDAAGVTGDAAVTTVKYSTVDAATAKNGTLYTVPVDVPVGTTIFIYAQTVDGGEGTSGKTFEAEGTYLALQGDVDSGKTVTILGNAYTEVIAEVVVDEVAVTIVAEDAAGVTGDAAVTTVKYSTVDAATAKNGTLYTVPVDVPVGTTIFIYAQTVDGGEGTSGKTFEAEGTYLALQGDVDSGKTVTILGNAYTEVIAEVVVDEVAVTIVAEDAAGVTGDAAVTTVKYSTVDAATAKNGTLYTVPVDVPVGTTIFIYAQTVDGGEGTSGKTFEAEGTYLALQGDVDSGKTVTILGNAYTEVIAEVVVDEVAVTIVAEDAAGVTGDAAVTTVKYSTVDAATAKNGTLYTVPVDVPVGTTIFIYAQTVDGGEGTSGKTFEAEGTYLALQGDVDSGKTVTILGNAYTEVIAEVVVDEVAVTIVAEDAAGVTGDAAVTTVKYSTVDAATAKNGTLYTVPVDVPVGTTIFIYAQTVDGGEGTSGKTFEAEGTYLALQGDVDSGKTVTILGNAYTEVIAEVVVDEVAVTIVAEDAAGVTGDAAVTTVKYSTVDAATAKNGTLYTVPVDVPVGTTIFIYAQTVDGGEGTSGKTFEAEGTYLALQGDVDSGKTVTILGNAYTEVIAEVVVDEVAVTIVAEDAAGVTGDAAVTTVKYSTVDAATAKNGTLYTVPVDVPVGTTIFIYAQTVDGGEGTSGKTFEAEGTYLALQGDVDSGKTVAILGNAYTEVIAEVVVDEVAVTIVAEDAAGVTGDAAVTTVKYSTVDAATAKNGTLYTVPVDVPVGTTIFIYAQTVDGGEGTSGKTFEAEGTYLALQGDVDSGKTVTILGNAYTEVIAEVVVDEVAVTIVAEDAAGVTGDAAVTTVKYSTVDAATAKNGTLYTVPVDVPVGTTIFIYAQTVDGGEGTSGKTFEAEGTYLALQGDVDSGKTVTILGNAYTEVIAEVVVDEVAVTIVAEDAAGVTGDAAVTTVKYSTVDAATAKNGTLYTVPVDVPVGTTIFIYAQTVDGGEGTSGKTFEAEGTYLALQGDVDSGKTVTILGNAYTEVIAEVVVDEVAVTIVAEDAAGVTGDAAVTTVKYSTVDAATAKNGTLYTVPVDVPVGTTIFIYAQTVDGGEGTSGKTFEAEGTYLALQGDVDSGKTVTILGNAYTEVALSVSDLTRGGTLLVGDYAFELDDGVSMNLDHFIRATRTAYFNSDTLEYEIYYSVLTQNGLKWVNLVSPYRDIQGGEDFDYIEDLSVINGNGGYYLAKNVVPPAPSIAR